MIDRAASGLRGAAIGPARAVALALGLILGLLVAVDAPAVSFNLVFDDELSTPQQQAVAAGADLWSQWLTDPTGSTVINIDVRMGTPGDGQSWVAQANTFWHFDRDSGLHIPRSAWKYRDGASSSNMDGQITFSTNVAWYTSTDGQPPSGTLDMATLMAHEIGHMLGMAASYINSGQVWGMFASGERRLRQYDTFLRDQNGESPEPGTGGSFDVLGDVVFVGEKAVEVFGGPVPIYAPSSYKQGSSLSHPHVNDQRALMHFASVWGTSMHGLYDYERAMFEDLEWIFHEPEHLTLAGSGGSTAHWHKGTTWDFGLPPVAVTHAHVHVEEASSDYGTRVTRGAVAGVVSIGGSDAARATLEITPAGALQVGGDVIVGDRAAGDARLTILSEGSAVGTLVVGGGLYIAGDEVGGNGATGLLSAAPGTIIDVVDDIRIWQGGTALIQSAHVAANGVDVQGGTVRTQATHFDADVSNHGQFTIDGEPSVVSVAGDYTQGEAGHLTLGVGEEDHSQLAIAGHASLAGTLELELGGATPPFWQAMPIITAGSLTGSFDEMIAPTPDNVFAALDYQPDGVQLLAGLIGDMNGDATVDAVDVAPFVLALTDPVGYQTLYGVDGSLPGDVTRAGVFDATDVAPFVAMLVGGDNAMAVPEPASALLFGVAAALLARRRRGA
ncbi:MAG: PEP-CTERM sorting domain-containing protein [Phycisphaeraceae bacterium]